MNIGYKKNIANLFIDQEIIKIIKPYKDIIGDIDDFNISDYIIIFIKIIKLCEVCCKMTRYMYDVRLTLHWHGTELFNKIFDESNLVLKYITNDMRFVKMFDYINIDIDEQYIYNSLSLLAESLKNDPDYGPSDYEETFIYDTKTFYDNKIIIFLSPKRLSELHERLKLCKVKFIEYLEYTPKIKKLTRFQNAYLMKIAEWWETFDEHSSRKELVRYNTNININHEIESPIGKLWLNYLKSCKFLTKLI